MKLKRFWFTFEDLPKFTPLNLGCGVTAYDYDDAILLIRLKVFPHGNVPPIRGVIENVDISTLDKGHVINHMGVPIDRGIWFPREYG